MSRNNPTAGAATEYSDFVIYGQRTSPKNIEVRVYLSPAGQSNKPVRVVFADSEAVKLRQSFHIAPGTAGQMLISQSEATEIGKRLAEVIFPAQVFGLLAQSIAAVSSKANAGLRIRLALDDSLVDLPWEYVYRPDRLDHEGVSGFLLLDPKISLVREAAQPRSALQQISGKQRLEFIGTYWEHQKDDWEVRKEFDLLRAALEPVASYIGARFTAATDQFEKKLGRDSAVFHYAGHCDFDPDGRAFMIREMSRFGLQKAGKVYIDDLAPKLGESGTRLAVMSACNSGFWSVVCPLLKAGLPAVIGVNGAVASISTIEFCAKLYESLAVGLTLDEAVARARLHVLEWGQQRNPPLFDWGLYMVYMPSPEAVLFPRSPTRTLQTRQASVRSEHKQAIHHTFERAKELDGLNFGEIMSELTQRRVLILGAFKGRRLKILKAIKEQLGHHPNGYIAELFTYKRPDSRELMEAIVGFAALSRFVIADLSEGRAVQQELDAIINRFQSVPIVPLINRTGREVATVVGLLRRENVVKPTVRYRDLDDLMDKLDQIVVPSAEAKLTEVRPVATR